MITKTFEHKGQMVNYYNKVIQNNNIDNYMCGYSVKYGSYFVSYSYKNNNKKLDK